MSAAEAQHTRGLENLRAQDADRFGGKSASLGELLQAGIPVPPGFAISTDAGEDLTDTLRRDIAARYGGLGQDVPVAVRSSALGEDSAEATFAGQQDTYLWVRGIDAVCEAVTKCWASLYSTEAVSYRKRFGVENPAMGVTIQLMVDASVSGVMFSCNPVSGDRSMVAINASWGLGLAVVGGEVTPDDYLVSKVTGEVVKRTINDKHLEYVPGGEGARAVDVVQARRKQPCLDEARLAKLVQVAKSVEKHFGAPQDIEWAFDQDGELFVLQSRPVTGLAKPEAKPAPTSAMSMIFNKFGAPG